MSDLEAAKKTSLLINPYLNLGEIEKWPSHPYGENTLGRNLITYNGRMHVVTDLKQTKQFNKPQFLQKLEKNVEDKLKVLYKSPFTPDARLQIFRETFTAILNEFRTYRPILAAIKEEYEIALDYLTERLKKMLPMKELIWTLSYEYDQRIINMQKKEIKEYSDLKKRVAQLEHQLVLANEEKKGFVKDAKILSQQLSEEYKKYRDEADARRLLIADINQLRVQFDELHLTRKANRLENESNEDPIMLRFALNEARRAQADAVQKLTMMGADYVDVVPKHLYESMFETLETHKQEIDTQRSRLLEQEEIIEMLKAQLNVTKEQRDEFFNELTALKTCSTPRPKWDELAAKLPCGRHRWKQLTTGKSTSDKVKILINDVFGSADKSRRISLFQEANNESHSGFHDSGKASDRRHSLKEIETEHNLSKNASNKIRQRLARV